jgi:hypothetical protein
MPIQPTPNVSSADVERIVRRDFPADRVAEVLGILNEYGQESWHREPDRVRLAVLKLASGSVERLRQEIDGAKCDYRDALAAAEYAGYLTKVPPSGALPAEEKQQIIDTDWKQYQDWFTR